MPPPRWRTPRSGSRKAPLYRALSTLRPLWKIRLDASRLARPDEPSARRRKGLPLLFPCRSPELQAVRMELQELQADACSRERQGSTPVQRGLPHEDPTIVGSGG
jgi:hypothetical protein